MQEELAKRISAKLKRLYGERAEELEKKLFKTIDRFRQEHPQLHKSGRKLLSEKDSILISYGDHFQRTGEAPLRTLSKFAASHLKAAFSAIHLLPHFPYSSDDGFSVIDYLKVDEALGAWADVRSSAENFELMFDAVINHISSQSAWFEGYKRGEEPYARFFLEANPSEDHTKVYRPRAKPLLTPVETTSGTKHVWTTFSEDQIDLNYTEPEVLERITEILLRYAEEGARLLRLDAVGFLWKTPGTNCFHLEETHLLVKLMRDIFDATCPAMVLVPEINGPYEENLPYLDDGESEAQLIYNFTLPPLILHSFGSQNAEALRSWLSSVKLPEGNVALFNFIACHDGLGVRAAQSLLSKEDFDTMVARAEKHGAVIGWRTGEDGQKTPYELNGTLWDLLNSPQSSDEEGIKRMLCAHAIALALPGVPGIYVHSLFGTPSWRSGFEKTGQGRTLNRSKFNVDELEASLLGGQPHQKKMDRPENSQTRAGKLFPQMQKLLSKRRHIAAFHPRAQCKVLKANVEVVALERTPLEAGRRVLAIHNLSTRDVYFRHETLAGLCVRDLIHGESVSFDETGGLSMTPLSFRWLAIE